MRRALAAARRASGRTWPNPPVGSVIVRGDRVLGVGATQPPGGPHAEIVALAAARRRHGAAALRGATLATTLEPCCHTGRTGPCDRAVIEAGIARVWVGERDPNPLVAGGGLRRLRRAGLDVRVGVLAAECAEQHRGFTTRLALGRPLVALKLAATLDGRIATLGGESRWITGPAARARVHVLRARSDAIAVGAETALADDPELTARRGRHVVHRPVRVVFDTGLRLSPRSRLARARDADRTWVLAGAGAPAARRRALEARGVRILEVGGQGGRLDLRRALARLGREGLTTLLVEGGGTLAAALLRAGLVDELHWFAAPSLLGGDARPALGPLAIRRLAGRVALEGARVIRLGPDLYIHGKVAGAPRTAASPPGPGRRTERAR